MLKQSNPVYPVSKDLMPHNPEEDFEENSNGLKFQAIGDTVVIHDRINGGEYLAEYLVSVRAVRNMLQEVAPKFEWSGHFAFAKYHTAYVYRLAKSTLWRFSITHEATKTSVGEGVADSENEAKEFVNAQLEILERHTRVAG